MGMGGDGIRGVKDRINGNEFEIELESHHKWNNDDERVVTI